MPTPTVPRRWLARPAGSRSLAEITIVVCAALQSRHTQDMVLFTRHHVGWSAWSESHSDINDGGAQGTNDSSGD